MSTKCLQTNNIWILWLLRVETTKNRTSLEKHFTCGYDVWLTNAFMAPALKWWWYWGLFSRAKYIKVGKGCP